MRAVITGSGKTLAFGIPMIHSILEWKSGSEEPGDAELPSEVACLRLPAEDGGVGEQGDCDSGESAGGDEGPDVDNELGGVELVEMTEFDAAAAASQKHVGGKRQPLLGLVLMPTRELAVQVKHHIDAVAKFTGKSLHVQSSTWSNVVLLDTENVAVGQISKQPLCWVEWHNRSRGGC